MVFRKSILIIFAILVLGLFIYPFIIKKFGEYSDIETSLEIVDDEFPLCLALSSMNSDECRNYFYYIPPEIHSQEWLQNRCVIESSILLSHYQSSESYCQKIENKDTKNLCIAVVNNNCDSLEIFQDVCKAIITSDNELCPDSNNDFSCGHIIDINSNNYECNGKAEDKYKKCTALTTNDINICKDID